MVGWNIGGRIIGKEVGDFHEMGNRELEEEMQANYAIELSQLEGLQYKLHQGNGRYSRF